MSVLTLRARLADYNRLMHFPLPLCVISFATLGAVIAPTVYLDRLVWTYLIVFTSLCLASYSFDELKGRPLRTRIPERELQVLGWAGLVFSLLAGFYLAYRISPVLLAWIPPSVLVIVGYNQELFQGRFHNSTVFSIGWGGIPTLGSYFLQTLTLSVTAILTSFATIMFSLAIWTLNHEFRPDFTAFKDLTLKLDGDVVAARRQARRRIWNITKMLCYTIALFTLAASYYRFFP
ncbi:MAG TPA: hypothetical protein VFE98_03670 [Candidatus Bathyarchaeia archaeon]|nr:hypothetical protein [Candidatus Bathyarchaeia archaeon]